MALTYIQPNIVIFTFLTILHLQHTQGIPLPGPRPSPQVLPGQIPPHLASHPALSSVTQGRESALMQYAYNIQNRRGPSPSPLVLQNNQERNLQLVNQLSQQRSGQQTFIPGNGGHVTGSGAHSHTHGNENPEVRALHELNKYKGGQTSEAQNAYNPAPLTPSNPGHLHHHPPQGFGPSGIHPADDNEGEDIKKLKSLLNISGRPLPGNTATGYSGVSGHPTIGVAGERGVINPTQYGQGQHPPHHDHNHGHNHPTPFPVTAQSRNSLGNLQYGQSSRPTVYPGTGGPTNGPVLHVPYGGNGHQHGHHGHEHPHQGQGRFNNYEYTFNQYNRPNPYDQYLPSRPNDHYQLRQNEFHHFRPESSHSHFSRPESSYSQFSRPESSYSQFRPNDIHHEHRRNEFDRYQPNTDYHRQQRRYRK